MTLAPLTAPSKPDTTTKGLTIDNINQRLIIESYNQDIARSILTQKWLSLAEEQDLEKIWLWAFPEDVADFNQCGFTKEGELPANEGDQPVVSLAYYVTKGRGQSTNVQIEDNVLEAITEASVKPLPPLPEELNLRLLTPADAPDISNLLSSVFVTYPSPVENPNYVKRLLAQGCIFAGAFRGRSLISVAAAYPDSSLGRCEITDCATLHEFRGHALTERLIKLLEPKVAQLGAYTLYTLARARSYGMNRVFFKLGYQYHGRLINNCHIAGKFEDMNLWVKA